MRKLWRGSLLAFALVLAVVTFTGASTAHPRPPRHVSGDTAPVASLEPVATAALWRQLIGRRSRQARAATSCRPLRAVFYAATDYLRLATKLAATESPCAQYYISVPPLVADKTQMRRDIAWRIRALGSNFHAMAEIHFATWTNWVQSTGSSWFVAGTTARQRMAVAGYDVAQGDTWVVNEVTSAVRKGTGNARPNLREFLRGLYEGDGTQPTRGGVFVIGVGQQTTDLAQYRADLQSWLSDSAFWADMSTYVSDWSQEVYGDVRSYAVPDAPISVRRDYLNDYLQHPLVLASAGPAVIDAARSYLQTAYSPVANAAWAQESGYGWTMVPPDQMANYVSAQVDALRSFSATAGQTRDHWGFAWHPRNASGLSEADFAAQTGSILDRLGAAIRDSALSVDPNDPGSAACGPPGQNLWCTGNLDGARFNEVWKSFRVWTQPVLTLASSSPAISAGAPSAVMSIGLAASSGRSITTRVPLAVSLASSSPQGTFSATPTGPWSNTLSLTIPAGASSSGGFYYLDTHAGKPVLTASATGATSRLQTVTVSPGPAVTISVVPASTSLKARETRRFAVAGSDTFGNVLAVSAVWSLTPARIGQVSPGTGSTTTLTASRALGDGTITAALGTHAGTVSATATFQVAPATLRISSIGYREGKSVVFVGVSAVDSAGTAVDHALVSVRVRRDGRRSISARAGTGAAGRAVFRVPARASRCFTTTIVRVSAQGFTWNGRTPANRYCRPRAR